MDSANPITVRRTFGATHAARVAISFVLAVAVVLLHASYANAACSATSPALNPSTGKLEINLGNCVGSDQAWALESDSAESQALFYPDINANYWLTSVPSIAGQDAHWELRGAMPDTRFTSMQSYTLTGETMDNVIDEEYAPDAGSVNWVTGGGFYPGAASVGYTMPVVQTTGGAPVPASSLRIDGDALDSSLGGSATLVYRVYPNTKPNGSTPSGNLTQRQWIARGQVDLPELVYVIDDPSKPYFADSSEIFGSRTAGNLLAELLKGVEVIGDTLAPILSLYPEATDKLWDDPVNWEANKGLSTNLRKMINPRQAPLAAALWQAGVSRLPDFTAFPNASTRYYVGGVNPGLGQVLLTKFKAPTTPEPDNGDPIRPAATSTRQLRYWSACLNNTLTLYMTGCIKDSQAQRDADGYVTLVASSTSTPPKGMNGQPAANWFRHGSLNELLLIRQTLASPSFTQSILFYPGAADDTAALKTFSGDYYPVSTYCSLNNYRYNDCRWRFNAYQEWLYVVSPRLFAYWYPR